jgi:hypothetical protein
MSMVGFPLLLIPLAIYNIVVFLMPGVSPAEPLVRLTLMSGAEWSLTLGDMLLTLGILMLLLEVIKGARPGVKYLTDHLLSLIVFGGAAAEFALWSRFGTSTYFLLTLLALVDFLSGISLQGRRRKQVASASGGAARDVKKSEPAFIPVNPVPEPAVSSAAAIAESVLLDRPALQSPAGPKAPSPEVPSPGLQPGEGSPPR